MRFTFLLVCLLLFNSCVIHKKFNDIEVFKCLVDYDGQPTECSINVYHSRLPFLNQTGDTMQVIIPCAGIWKEAFFNTKDCYRLKVEEITDLENGGLGYYPLTIREGDLLLSNIEKCKCKSSGSN